MKRITIILTISVALLIVLCVISGRRSGANDRNARRTDGGYIVSRNTGRKVQQLQDHNVVTQQGGGSAQERKTASESKRASRDLGPNVRDWIAATQIADKEKREEAMREWSRKERIRSEGYDPETHVRMEGRIMTHAEALPIIKSYLNSGDTGKQTEAVEALGECREYRDDAGLVSSVMKVFEETPLTTAYTPPQPPDPSKELSSPDTVTAWIKSQKPERDDNMVLKLESLMLIWNSSDPRKDAFLTAAEQNEDPRIRSAAKNIRTNGFPFPAVVD